MKLAGFSTADILNPFVSSESIYIFGIQHIPLFLAKWIPCCDKWRNC